MFDFNTNEGYFLHLLKCGLKSEKPEEPPVGIDFEAIFELAKKQDVENIVFLSVDQLENTIDSNLYSVWQEAYYKRMKYSAFQDMALEELIDVFTKAGIDCMPLKGSVIKNYYPSPDLRCMGDIDFLVREQNRQVVRDIMHRLGYEDDILDDGQVDAFKRGKLEYIEVHYDFSAKNHVMHEVFTIDWNNLQPTETEHLYEMTFEDLYFFNTGHYVKNMHNKGMGLRGVVDTFVLWNKLNDEEKASLINRFEIVGINDFHSKLVKISNIWFEDAEDDDSLNDLQDYLLIKKTYGDYKTEIILDALYANQTSSNMEYLKNKIFPSANVLYELFGVKNKCFLILPFLWFRRIFSQLLGSKEKWAFAKQQMNTFKKIDQSDIDYERKIREKFGLL